MSWRDNLRQASFRGASFKILDARTEVGRRNALHEYPFKDIPYIEDLGAKADQFIINAYIIQNIDNDFDYFNARDTLISALKQSGAGTLIHPFLGEMQVSVFGQATLTESFQEGGIARFTITFIQSGQSIFPSQIKEPKSAMDKVAELAGNIAGDNLVDTYTYIQSRAGTVINDLTSFVSMTKNTIHSVRGSLTSTVSKAIATVNNLRTDINSIINSGPNIATFINSSINSVLFLIGESESITSGITGSWSGDYRGNVISLPGDPLPEFLGVSEIDALIELSRFGESTSETNPSLYGGQLEDITVNNKNDAYEAINREVMTNMGRVLAIINAVRVAIRIDYDSYNKAIEITQTITDRIDELMIVIGDQAGDTTYSDYGIVRRNDDMYEALEKLRVEFVTIMRQIAANLAKIINYAVPPAVLPSLVLSYQKYNDLDREDEIIRRNKGLIKNPGFLPEGLQVEILNE